MLRVKFFISKTILNVCHYICGYDGCELLCYKVLLNISWVTLLFFSNPLLHSSSLIQRLNSQQIEFHLHHIKMYILIKFHLQQVNHKKLTKRSLCFSSPARLVGEGGWTEADILGFKILKTWVGVIDWLWIMSISCKGGLLIWNEAIGWFDKDDEDNGRGLLICDGSVRV